MNVLLIEDYEPLAHVIAAMLRPIAKKVKVTETLSAARTELEKPNGFDVVFLDINLPDSNAQRLAEIVRAIKRTGRKVVMMTGSHLDMDEFAKHCGADACFYKWDVDFTDKLKRSLSS